MSSGKSTLTRAVGYIAPMKSSPTQLFPIYEEKNEHKRYYMQRHEGLSGRISLLEIPRESTGIELFPDYVNFEIPLEELRQHTVLCIRLAEDKFEIGKTSNIVTIIRKSLNKGYFEKNPFVGVEVAHAVKEKNMQTHFAKLCVDKLAEKSPSLAYSWASNAIMSEASKLVAFKRIKTHSPVKMERREEAWSRLEEAFTAEQHVNGVIFKLTKGGCIVDLGGAVAFLPRSQVDIRPIRDVTPLMKTPQLFKILKMDKRRGNIVVSRRTVLEESRAEQRSEIFQHLEVGQTIEGMVKNIADYGAFIDLGGIDGLLHVTDMAWRRVKHPTEILSIGQTVKVQIIRINQDTHRISLGMKQLESDPWDGIDAKYPIEAKITGRVTNITDYGAFVEVEPGIEGMIHVSEMSWTKKNVHPGKILSTSQEVEVVVLEVDPEKRRISLGLKQTLDNPWASFATQFPVGQIVEGKVKNKTEFGLFIGLEGDVDGMVHLSDLDWNRQGEEAIEEYNKGEMVKAIVLDVDIEKERISLGIKQIHVDEILKGSTVEVEVLEITSGGLTVKIVHTDIEAFIRRIDLSRDRDEQRPERFSVGQRVDARVTQYIKKDNKVQVSIKALEIADEKEAVAQFGSSDSGATLGEILAAALKQIKKM